jgi:hypothetical protein
MLRSTASKVMWVGRATAFLVGLAVILALLFGVASMALGANGNPLILGKAKNTASKVTGLVKSGAGPALNLKVDSGPPMAVNSTTTVAKLNADKLDGKDSSALLGSNVKSRFAIVEVSDGSNNSANVECADGEHATGGGAALTAFVSDVAIISSRPAVADNNFEQPPDGEPFDAWRATAVNPSGGTGAVHLRAFVVCAA